MMTRRTLIESAAALLLANAAAQPATSRNRQVFQHDLPKVSLDNWVVTAIEVVYGPGESTAAHSHPGITVAYVLEGEIRSKVGDAPEQTFKPGQMFIEYPGEVHAVSGNASDSKPAKLLAILMAEKGKPLTSMVK
jgi:quercetin dioxygenase-like cupin family protein